MGFIEGTLWIHGDCDALVGAFRVSGFGVVLGDCHALVGALDADRAVARGVQHLPGCRG